jgi:hypothetical protein
VRIPRGQPDAPAYGLVALPAWLPPGVQVTLLAEQIGISQARDVRALVLQPPMMGLQAKRQGRDEKDKKQETSHGNNLAVRGFLPTVADMTHCERKMPSHVDGV